MTAKYCEYFGFKSEPFDRDIAVGKLLKLPGMLAVKERMDFCLQVGGTMIVTGEVGSGKSTSMRWCLSQYHPSETEIFSIVGASTSILDFYRDLCWTCDMQIMSPSRTLVTRRFRAAVQDLVMGKRKRVLLVIDEAHLLRDEILNEIHTLGQIQHDSVNLFATVFTGQVDLLERLRQPRFRPLASRVVGRSHLEALPREQMEEYLMHHLKVVGCKRQLFSQPAILAIHQGSGGFLRAANSLARGALLAAAREQRETVEPEHVRIAQTETMIQ